MKYNRITRYFKRTLDTSRWHTAPFCFVPAIVENNHGLVAPTGDEMDEIESNLQKIENIYGLQVAKNVFLY